MQVATRLAAARAGFQTRREAERARYRRISSVGRDGDSPVRAPICADVCQGGRGGPRGIERREMTFSKRLLAQAAAESRYFFRPPCIYQRHSITINDAFPCDPEAGAVLPILVASVAQFSKDLEIVGK